MDTVAEAGVFRFFRSWVLSLSRSARGEERSGRLALKREPQIFDLLRNEFPGSNTLFPLQCKF